MPRISIIIAAHNAKPELCKLLDGLLLSEFKDFEVCIHDDASADGTGDAARSYAGRLDLKVSSGPENLGPAGARNAALARSSAPLLLFLDADISTGPQTIGRLLALLESSGADVAQGIYSARALDPGPFSDYYAAFAHHSFLLAGRVERYNVFNAWCALARREAIESVGGHRPLRKGVEAENETLGRDLAAAGFNIVMEPSIEVDHHWGGWRKLLYIFTSRIYWWVKVWFAFGRRCEAAMTTGSYGAGTAALPAAALALASGLPGSGYAAAALAAVFLAAYGPFQLFLLRRRGPLFALWGFALSAALTFPAAASAAYSAAGELVKIIFLRRTTLGAGEGA
ncbi:MAG TPA: hypothetical protein DEQ38_03965 [Elusimicrobia bacterium]|nr:MAG: hypothetical protein A2089_12965 [Elusimicrobia bacterium GWD2_63_28]HCC47261.1 hypothetical protein [Elusimicrobiota bacterium]